MTRQQGIRALIFLVILAAGWFTYAALTSSRRDPNVAPPGVAAHLPGATATARANGPGGTCRLLTTTQIKAALGGTVSAPSGDNLTPGLDRCSWTITGSTLNKKAVVLVVSHSNLPPAKPPHLKQHRGHPSSNASSVQAVPTLDSAATWTPQQRALTWPSGHGSMTLQLVAPQELSLDDTKTLTLLTELAIQSRH